MKRKIYDKLVQWKDSNNRKPLIVFGARQVGKTYVIREFCKNEFANFYEVNLFEKTDIIELYESNQNADEKYRQLLSFCGIQNEDENTVLFVDEIQESPTLISNLKYINENHPELRIICAGSLLGVMLKRSDNKKSFPVGKVDMLTMYQLDFEEYLMAFNEVSLIEEIRKHYGNNTPMLESMHNKALNYYTSYLYTGGMPESVQNIVDNDRNIALFDNSIVENITKSYFEDMYKYVANSTETVKIERIFSSVPSQLGNDSHKFQYNKINSDARKRDYDSSLDRLLSSRIVLKSNNVKTPKYPLNGFIDLDIFKIYMNDIGILRNMLNISYSNILNNDFKGIMAENYVAFHLKSLGYDLLYYKNDSSTLEIDFLYQNENGIIPIEVKSAENTQSKSLNSFIQKYNPVYSIKVSTKNFGFVNNIKSIPLYAVFLIK